MKVSRRRLRPRPARPLAFALVLGLAAGAGAQPAAPAEEVAQRAAPAEGIARRADPEAARARYAAEDWQTLLGGEVVQRSRAVDAAPEASRRARGAIVVDAPPERVWAVLEDHRAWPRIFPRLRELEVVSENGDQVGLRHTAEVFWMDFTWQTLRSSDPARGHIAVRLDPEHPGDLEAAESHWQLVPLEGGARTLVEFRTHLEVGRGVPGWVEQRLAEQGLPEQLRALRREVERRAEEGAEGAGGESA